jgi:hypothetical protein
MNHSEGKRVDDKIDMIVPLDVLLQLFDGLFIRNNSFLTERLTIDVITGDDVFIGRGKNAITEKDFAEVGGGAVLLEFGFADWEGVVVEGKMCHDASENICMNFHCIAFNEMFWTSTWKMETICSRGNNQEDSSNNEVE